MLSGLEQLFAQQQQSGGFMTTIDKLARTPLSSVLIFVAVLTAIRIALITYMKAVPQHQRFGAYTAARFGNDIIDALIYAGIVVFMVLRPFAIQTFFIPTESMVKTLMIKDFIVANKAVYRYSDPKPGDIVVFRPPAWGIPPGQNVPGAPEMDYIKRCVGAPGDVVEVRDSQLFRNGQAINEPYLNEKSYRFNFKLVQWKGEIFPLTEEGGVVNAFGESPPKFQLDPNDWANAWEQPAVALPKGQYLMMGDNRNRSYDGRFWGPVSRDSIIGRSEFIWLPFSRMSRTR